MKPTSTIITKLLTFSILFISWPHKIETLKIALSLRPNTRMIFPPKRISISLLRRPNLILLVMIVMSKAS